MDYSLSTLRKVLYKSGFTWKKTADNGYVLVETFEDPCSKIDHVPQIAEIKQEMELNEIFLPEIKEEPVT